MPRSKLRVYFGPQDSATAEADSIAGPSVTVPLGEVIPALAEAAAAGRAWLRDFEDDEITISHDLYEVLLAYQHYQRPSA